MRAAGGDGGAVVAPEPGPGASPGRAPWLRFALIFGALGVSSEILYYGLVLDSEIFSVYLRVLARLSGAILGVFFEGIRVQGAQISGLGFSVEVADGCDALQVCALLTAAVIAFPAPLGHKLRGIAQGIVVLQVLNLLRIMSLFVIGARFSRVFQTTHEVVWPTFLIATTVLFWVLWVRRETRDGPELEPGA